MESAVTRKMAPRAPGQAAASQQRRSSRRNIGQRIGRDHRLAVPRADGMENAVEKPDSHEGGQRGETGGRPVEFARLRRLPSLADQPGEIPDEPVLHPIGPDDQGVENPGLPGKEKPNGDNAQERQRYPGPMGLGGR